MMREIALVDALVVLTHRLDPEIPNTLVTGVLDMESVVAAVRR